MKEINKIVNTNFFQGNENEIEKEREGTRRQKYAQLSCRLKSRHLKCEWRAKLWGYKLLPFLVASVVKLSLAFWDAWRGSVLSWIWTLAYRKKTVCLNLRPLLTTWLAFCKIMTWNFFFCFKSPFRHLLFSCIYKIVFACFFFFVFLIFVFIMVCLYERMQRRFVLLHTHTHTHSLFFKMFLKLRYKQIFI